jgi:hypothetical protein
MVCSIYATVEVELHQVEQFQRLSQPLHGAGGWGDAFFDGIRTEEFVHPARCDAGLYPDAARILWFY